LGRRPETTFEGVEVSCFAVLVTVAGRPEAFDVDDVPEATAPTPLTTCWTVAPSEVPLVGGAGNNV
jgi:hypothetical protein